MNIGTLFWVIMLILLIFGFVVYWPVGTGVVAYGPLGSGLVTWVLLALLGWRVFGPMLKN